MSGPNAEAVPVYIHPSQFPEALTEAFKESLRLRQMNPKFLYNTAKQTELWLRVHEMFCPLYQADESQDVYRNAFTRLAEDLKAEASVEILSLGCGNGQKEARLIRALRRMNPAIRVDFVGVDVSTGLALIARDAAIAAGVEAERCRPFVMDLGFTKDWQRALKPVLTRTQTGPRIVAFFGMMPNFPPLVAFPQLAALCGPEDSLILSANLSPGAVYAEGVQRVFPQYDNEPTREWLLSVLLDVGIDRNAGRLELGIKDCPDGTGLMRIEANFIFTRGIEIRYGGDQWHFAEGERFLLFYSYRHTVDSISRLLNMHEMKLVESWINATGEEGAFVGKL